MPANLSPEYKAAEAHFRQAREPKERLEWLREMLRVIPKHKGTDHLQGDIKRKIKDLADELEGPRKGGARSTPAVVTRPEGAAQLALIGPPNSGKSSLHMRLTGSHAHVAPYPFTTLYPEPGMMPHADIHFQLLDLPAISPEHPVPWIADAVQTADACLLVVDLSDPECVEQVQALGKAVGVGLNPATPLGTLEDIVEELDLLLLMTVNPGFGGQRFITSVLPKLQRARALLRERAPSCELEVDGGVDLTTGPLALAAGADVLVAGTCVFAHEGGAGAGVRALREACARGPSAAT